MDATLRSPAETKERVPQNDIIAWKCDGTRVLEIVGNFDTALWMSMYAFLQYIVGFRWFFPGKEGEDVPRLRELKIEKMERIIVPSYVLRNFHWWPEQWQTADWFCCPPTVP